MRTGIQVQITIILDPEHDNVQRLIFTNKIEKIQVSSFFSYSLHKATVITAITSLLMGTTSAFASRNYPHVYIN